MRFVLTGALWIFVGCGSSTSTPSHPDDKPIDKRPIDPIVDVPATPADPKAAVLLDRVHHDAHFVHVRAEHDVRPAPSAGRRAVRPAPCPRGTRGRDPSDQAPHGVDFERIDPVPHGRGDEGAHLRFAAAHTRRVGEGLEEVLAKAGCFHLSVSATRPPRA